MKILACAALLLLVSEPVFACPVTQSVAERYGISFSGFKTDIPQSAPPDTAHSGPFVRLPIQDTTNISDGFHHSLVVDRTKNKAWILRTGGFLGVYEWYGPVAVTADSLKACRADAFPAAGSNPQQNLHR